MPYDLKFDPIIVTKYEDRKLLPSGKNYTIKEKLEIIENRISDEKARDKSIGNSYRFAMLKERVPTDVTMGIGGFNEYLMFEYIEENLMILENLNSGNATFIFTLNKFDKERPLNKQTASKDPSFLKRIVHDNIESWGTQLSQYFKSV